MGSLNYELPVTLELEDLDELSDEEAQSLEQDVRASLEAISDSMENMAQALSPVRTGNLMFSIHSEVSPSDLWVSLGASADYASFVERGTYKMPPRPFLQPAADMGREEIDTQLEEAIISRLDGKLDSDEAGDNVTLEVEGQATRFEGGLFGALEKLE